MTRMTVRCAALGALGLLALSGCTDTPAQESSESPPEVSVDEGELGGSLERIVLGGLPLPGGAEDSEELRACLITAVEASSISAGSLVVIQESAARDQGQLVREVGDRAEDSAQAHQDAFLLQGSQVRRGMEACLAEQLGVDLSAPATVIEAPAPAPEPQVVAPVTAPAFPERAGLADDITESFELGPGLVSMLGSFAPGEQQEQQVREGQECLSEVVYDAGFSQQALHFFAGGAPLGSGTVAEHLPEADAELWGSWRVQEDLSLCLDPGVQQQAAENKAEDAAAVSDGGRG